MAEERYEIIKLLGKGRTGGVYEATDSNLGRKVALRRFFAQTKETEIDTYKTDFEKVAHSLSALQHPNLLRVYDAGVDNDGAYIISQLLHGVTLHNHLEENGQMPYWMVNDLAQQMLDALSASHEAGYVHGAITPGSILLSPRARGGFLYVILDMGLSRLAPLIQGKDSILSIMADPAILAPELFAGGIASESADLYMIGHILYMSLVGGHPFAGVPAIEAEALHGKGLPPITQFIQDVPADFQIWLEKLIQFDPNKRPASAVDALNSLPKATRPSTNQTTAIHTISTNQNPEIAIHSQSPTAGAAVNQNPALAGVQALSFSETKKNPKKMLFIGLGLLAVIAVIIIIISNGPDNDKTKLTSNSAERITEAADLQSNSKSSIETKNKVISNTVENNIKPVKKEVNFPVVKASTLLVDFNGTTNSDTQANYIGVDRNSTTIKTNLAANGSSISLSFNFHGTADHKRDRDRRAPVAAPPQSDLFRDFIFGDKTSKKGHAGLTIILGPLAPGDYTFKGFHHDTGYDHGVGTIRINDGTVSTFNNSTGHDPTPIGMSKVNFTSDGVDNVVIFIDNALTSAVINGFAIETIP